MNLKDAALSPEKTPVEALRAIMVRLRGPNGCPWDREQTLQTLKPYLIEEAYEVLDALDRNHDADLCEELGDLLLQVVFQSQIAEEENRFTLDDVARGICEKLIRRHPHVFGNVEVEDSAAVIRNWDAIKRAEKEHRPASLIDGVPAHLPALLKAREVQKRVSRAGFDWPDRTPVAEKVMEEWSELLEAVEDESPERIQDELGDLLFSVVNLSRFLDCDPEEALRSTVDKFRRRFQHLEEALSVREVSVESCSLDELDELWEAAKRQEGEGSRGL